MARPRPGDARGNKPRQGRGVLRRPPDHGVPLATPVSGFARLGQAQDADRHRRGGRDLHPGIVQGPALRSSRRPRRRGGKAKHPGLYFETIPILVARDRQGATVDAVLPNVDSASIAAAFDGLVTPANRFVCDGGKAIVAFARRANIPVHLVPAPGKPSPEAPDLHINNVNAYHGRLKEWMRRFHGVATKNLPNYLGWRRALEAWGDQATRQNWILGAIGIGPYQQQTL